MGISDSKWLKMTCEICGTSETVIANDHGSQWSPPHWHAPTSAQKFTVVSTGGGKAEPEIQSAICKQCLQPASVNTGYGQPSG